VPVGDVLVGDTGGDIEHDDATLAVDVVSVTKTSELLLSCGIPYIELNVAQVLLHVSGDGSYELFRRTYRAESERVDFDTKGCDILLLELSSQMALDERGLPKC
jgi:hypothetical protein